MVQYDIIENLKVCEWNVRSHRLEEIFRKIFLKPMQEPTVIHIFEPLNDPSGEVAKRLQFDFGVRNVFILFSAEGHGEQEYDILLGRLTQTFGRQIRKDDIILYTAAFDLAGDEFRHVQNWSGILNNTLDLSGRHLHRAPATKFATFLNRIHRWQRQALFEKLHELNLLDQMHASYVSTPPDTNYKNLYPKILDKDVVSFEDGYNLEVGADATFNIVAESSYENISDLTSIEVPGVSEKTYKTILSCQIPIFLSTAYTVYHFRIMGFDVFDDIVDHSYDLIEDPVLRIDAVATEIKRLSRYWTTSYDSELRTELEPRFKKNLELMELYSHPNTELLSWYRQFSEMGMCKNQSIKEKLHSLSAVMSLPMFDSFVEVMEFVESMSIFL